jgi:hypothetical protein
MPLLPVTSAGGKAPHKKIERGKKERKGRIFFIMASPKRPFERFMLPAYKKMAGLKIG